MAVITIREQSPTDTGFDATLVIEGNNYNITISDPFEDQQEQTLEWYFEKWLRYPILDNVNNLQQAIELNPRYRQQARSDRYFDNIASTELFERIL